MDEERAKLIKDLYPGLWDARRRGPVLRRLVPRTISPLDLVSTADVLNETVEVLSYAYEEAQTERGWRYRVTCDGVEVDEGPA